MKSKGFKSQKG